MNGPVQVPTFAPRALPDQGGLPMRAILTGVAGLWLVPTLLTVTEGPEGNIFLATTLAAAVSALAILLRPSTALVALPFFALLSPMTGLLDVAGGKVVYSDLLFLLLGVQAMLIALKPGGRFRRLPTNRSFVYLAGIYLLGTLVGFGLGNLVSLKPLVYFAQMATLYVFTRTYCTTSEDRANLIHAWTGASLLAALILLQAYLQSKNLDNLKDVGAQVAVATDDVLYVFRATYYYSGIHYVLGICVVWMACRLFFPASLPWRLFQVATLGVLAWALAAMLNKTAMVAVLIAILWTGWILNARYKREMRSPVLWFGGGLSVALAFFAWKSYALLQDPQVLVIANRLSGSSSLITRFEVYAQAMGVWASSVGGWIVGSGPDLLDGSGNPVFATLFKTSKTTGMVEGTLDSAWLSYLVELGIPGALILILIFRQGIRRLRGEIVGRSRFDEGTYLSACFAGGMVFLFLAMLTQMLGYSKTAWLPFQMLIVGISFREDSGESVPFEGSPDPAANDLSRTGGGC